MFKKLFHSFSLRYLSYTKSELRGSTVLIFLLTVQLLFLFFTRNTDTGKAEPRITVIELPPDDDQVSFNNQTGEAGDTEAFSSFDPNTADHSTLTIHGLSDELSQRIIRYRENGGRFRSANDLLKIYGMDQAAFRKVVPHVIIQDAPANEHGNASGHISGRMRSAGALEINKADSADLEALPLIGPKRASMIIKYRRILGGFVSKDQLLEVYSIDSAVYQVITDRIEVDPELVKHIAINRINADSLYHPYLTRKQAGMIIRYRDNHGIFADLETVCRAALLNDKLCAKIAPYFTLD